MVELRRCQRHVLCTADIHPWTSGSGHSRTDLELLHDRLHSEISSIREHTSSGSNDNEEDTTSTVKSPATQRWGQQSACELAILQTQLDIVHRYLQQHGYT